MIQFNHSANETDVRLLPRFTTIVFHVLVCYGITLASLLLFAVVITYTAFPEQFAPAVVLVLTAISVMMSAMLSARHSTSKGWLVGGISGLVYMVTLYCIGSLLFRSVTFGINVLSMLAFGFFSGCFGGMVGINMKSKRKKR